MKIFEYHDQKIYDLFSNQFPNDTIVNLKFGDSFRYDSTVVIKPFMSSILKGQLADYSKQMALLEKSLTLTERDYTKEFKRKYIRPSPAGCSSWLRVMQHEWEPIDVVLDKELWGNYFDYKSNFKKLFVLHSEKNSKDINVIKKLGFIPIHYFAHGYLCAEHWYRLYKDISIVTAQRPIEHAWVSMNRLIDNKRSYRIKLLNMLNVDEGIYSLLEKDPQTGATPTEIYPKNIVQPHSFDSHENSSAWIEVLKPTPINTSFLHVVNEAVVDKQHLTEKIFKPIVLKQPFVLMGGQGTLQYLRDYGFKTFKIWLDEDYDDIDDLDKRMQAVANVINNIGKLPLKQLEHLREDMQEVLEYNYNWFHNGFGSFCLNELTTQIAEY